MKKPISNQKLVDIVLTELLAKYEESPELFDYLAYEETNFFQEKFKYAIGFFGRKKGRLGWEEDDAIARSVTASLTDEGIVINIFNRGFIGFNRVDSFRIEATFSYKPIFKLFNPTWARFKKLRRYLLNKANDEEIRKLEEAVNKTFPNAVDRLLLE